MTRPESSRANTSSEGMNLVNIVVTNRGYESWLHAS